MSMQNERAFLKTILKRKEKSFIGAQVRRADGDTQSSQSSQSSGEGLTLGIHTAYQKKKKKKGKTGHGGGGGLAADVRNHHEEKEHIPESYRLYLLFLVCARLYDFNLMATRKVFVLFSFVSLIFISRLWKPPFLVSYV